MKTKSTAIAFLIPILAWASSSAFSAQLVYSARFTLNGTSMKILIHNQATGAQSGPHAQILSGEMRLASCAVKSIERDETTQPVAVVMDCQNPAFKQLSNTVTVFWPGMNPQNTPVIRFGTWLSGYEQAQLKVDVDRYKTPVLTEKKSAPKSAAFWMKKPRVIVKVAKSS